MSEEFWELRGVNLALVYQLSSCVVLADSVALLWKCFLIHGYLGISSL